MFGVVWGRFQGGAKGGSGKIPGCFGYWAYYLLGDKLARACAGPGEPAMQPGAQVQRKAALEAR